MSICNFHPVSSLTVRPKLFLRNVIHFTACRPDLIPLTRIPWPRQPHENLRAIAVKMLGNVTEHSLCLALS